MIGFRFRGGRRSGIEKLWVIGVALCDIYGADGVGGGCSGLLELLMIHGIKEVGGEMICFLLLLGLIFVLFLAFSCFLLPFLFEIKYNIHAHINTMFFILYFVEK